MALFPSKVHYGYVVGTKGFAVRAYEARQVSSLLFVPGVCALQVLLTFC